MEEVEFETANLTRVLPTCRYPSMALLVQDIKRSLRTLFPSAFTMERDTLPFQVFVDPITPTSATCAFRPDDRGVSFAIVVEDLRVKGVYRNETVAFWVS